MMEEYSIKFNDTFHNPTPNSSVVGGLLPSPGTQNFLALRTPPGPLEGRPPGPWWSTMEPPNV